MGELKLLFIHGAGGTKSKWRETLPYLEAGNFEAIDLPGHGESDVKDITSIQDYASFVSKDIKEDTIIVGHSMGGLVAIETAKRNKKVKGIVLVGSHYELPVDQKLVQIMGRGEFPKSFFYAAYNKEASEELLKRELEEIDLVPIEVTHTDFIVTNQYRDGLDAISNLHIPICAILGEKDRLLPKDAKQNLINQSNIKISTIEGAGHYIMLEKPQEFADVLMSFVKEVAILR